MKKIVITGGIGAGKTAVLKYLQENVNCKIIRADDVAHILMEPHEKCYYEILNAFPEYDLLKYPTVQNHLDNESVNDKNPFDKEKLSRMIFSNEDNRDKLNSIVHPAVKEYILEDVQSEEDKGEIDYYFLEVALAIEEGYDKLFDETWYVYAGEKIRAKRLETNRGYSEEKITGIMNSQLSEEEYKLHATHIICNDNSLDELYANIGNILHCD